MKPTSWQIGVAAEAIAACIFARLGYNVAVQYGPNQPEYDLTISIDDNMLKVSVKGSQDGDWGLTQSYLENRNYHKAADVWLSKHKRKTIICLVQFSKTTINEMPRMYLATPAEIANRLKESANGRGDTILYENKVWTKKAVGFGTIDKIPDEWKLSEKRVIDLFAEEV